jgi:hypothetical protein
MTMVSSYGNGVGNNYIPHASTSSSSSYPRQQPELRSLTETLIAEAQSLYNRLQRYSNGRGRVLTLGLAMQFAHRLKMNLAARRLLSFPHLLVALWVIILLWGERWTFTSKVDSCDWDHWEKWVSRKLRIPVVKVKKACQIQCTMGWWEVCRMTFAHQTLSTASRSDATPSHICCRSPAHRPTLVSGAPMAIKPLDVHHYRQLPPKVIQCAAEGAATRYGPLPGR